MNKKFIINLGFLFFINLLVKPFYIFGIDRKVQNVVAGDQYGLFVILFDLSFLFAILSDLGIQNFNNREISQYPILLPKYFPNLLSTKLFLGVGYGLFMILTMYLLGYGAHISNLGIWIIFNQILLSFLLYLRSNVSGLGYYLWDSIFSSVEKLLLIFIAGYLLYYYEHSTHFQIEWFIYAQTISLFITCLILYGFIRSKITQKRQKFNFKLFQIILKKSVPYAILIFLMTSYSRIDKILLGQLLENGEEEAAIYAASFRILDMLNMIGYLFASLLLPMFAKLLITDRSEVDKLLNLSLKLILILVTPIVISIFLLRLPIMELLYLKATPYWSDILGVLIINFLALATMYIFSTLLTANDSIKPMNRIYFIGFIINLILNFILIPKYGGYGAAIASLSCHLIMLVQLILLSNKIIQIKIEAGFIVKFIFFFLLTAIGIYFILPVLRFEIWYQMIVTSTLGLIISILVGFFPLKSILYSLKNLD